MKFTTTRLAAIAILSTASAGALAVPVAWHGSLARYDHPKGKPSGPNGVAGYSVVEGGEAWPVASPGASGIDQGPGDVPAAGIPATNPDWGSLDAVKNDRKAKGAWKPGHSIDINIDWHGSSRIDWFQLWNISSLPAAAPLYASINPDGSGIRGISVLHGRGVNVVFNVPAPIPEASTAAMMLAGLGLVGGMAARRRRKG